MAYAPLDEHFDEHPKFEDLELEHLGLMACAFSYCNRLLTDGFVSDRAVRGFGRSGKGPRVALKLVEKGIWKRVDGGFEVVGFLDHNPSRAEVLAKREAARARKEAQRKRGLSENVTRDSPRDGPRDSHVTSRAGAIHFDPLHCTSIQGHSSDSSPPPGGSDERTSGTQEVAPKADAPKRSKPARGSRIPDGWKPSEAVLEWARQEGILDPLGPLDEFVDFWRGVTGQKGVKADWDATYRNRLRQLVESGRLEVRKPIARPQPAPAKREPVLTAEERAAALRQLDESIPPLFREVMSGSQS